MKDGCRFIILMFTRICDPEEMYEVGFDDYIESGGVCLIEWGKPDRRICFLRKYHGNIYRKRFEKRF